MTGSKTKTTYPRGFEPRRLEPKAAKAQAAGQVSMNGGQAELG